MKQKTEYITPTIKVKHLAPRLMGLIIEVSNSEVDDEATKKREHEHFDNGDYGKIDNSLW